MKNQFTYSVISRNNFIRFHSVRYHLWLQKLWRNCLYASIIAFALGCSSTAYASIDDSLITAAEESIVLSTVTTSSALEESHLSEDSNADSESTSSILSLDSTLTGNIPENGWDSTNTYYYVNGNKLTGQQNIDGYWYLFDRVTGAMCTGFQNLASYGQDKIVYYNAQGHMLYGLQNISNNTYLFQAATTSSMSGKMLVGQQSINGNWYLFDRISGVMLTGFQNLASYGQDKIVYYNAQGHMLYGLQHIDNNTYLFQAATTSSMSGKMLTGVQKVNGKFMYFQITGQLDSNYLLFGEQYIDGKWYLVDRAANILTGFQNLISYGQDKICYYSTDTGQMLYNQQYIDGYWYLFDQYTGKQYIGQQYISDQRKRVLYNRELGAAGYMLYGQQFDQGNWYLFDKHTGAMQYGFQNLTPYGQNKTVYYDFDGTMKYGLFVKDDNYYYFDTITGASYSAYDTYMYIWNQRMIDQGSRIVEEAIVNGLTYVGNSPYLWGGGRTSASIAARQFDCSSFISWMYHLAGKTIDDQGTTTTYSLINKGTADSWANKKRGDLLFLPSENIHVMIYLGNGFVLHSSPNTPTGGVGINRLSDLNPDFGKTWGQLFYNGPVRRVA